MARARGDDVIQIRPLIPRGRILAYLVWNYTLEYRMSEGGEVGEGGGGGNLLQRGATCSGVGCPGRRSTPEKIARGCRLLRSRLHVVQVTNGLTVTRIYLSFLTYPHWKTVDIFYRSVFSLN